jgi:methylmalonyl-CoA mutase C-terminal domain/subunit
MRQRVLIAKPGLDGHDRGAKVVARILRDAGYEVIYTGIRQKPDEIAATAVQEDVDLVGLSVLSGAHVGLTRKVVAALAEHGGDDIAVVVGGTIPKRDRERLLEVGADAVFATGSTSDEIVAGVAQLLDPPPAKDADLVS